MTTGPVELSAPERKMPLRTRIFERLYRAKLRSHCQVAAAPGARNSAAVLPLQTSSRHFFGPKTSPPTRAPSEAELCGECSFEWLQPRGQAASELPVLLFFHGGAWVASDRSDPVYRQFLASFVAKGFHCLNVNYRKLGSSASKLTDCLEDVAAVVEFVLSQNIADAAARGIVLVGHSAGAHLVLQAQMGGFLNRFQSILRGICSIGGVYDLLDFRKRASGLVRMFAMAPFRKMSEDELLRLSPRHTRFRGSSCPVRLLHGEREGFILVQAQEYLLALQAQKCRASLRVFPGHTHLSLLRPYTAPESHYASQESIVPDLVDFATECGHSYVKLQIARAAPG